MENIKFNSIGAFFVSGFTYIIGGWDQLMPLLVTLVSLDIIGGVMASLNNRDYNGLVFRKGLLKKLYMFVVIAAAFQIGRVIGYPVLREAFICYYAAGEAISIIKNSAEFGLPYPEKIMDFLEKFKEKINDMDPDKGGK